MADLLETFGQAVRQVREEKGWSQERLAAEAGLDRTYVSGLERGRRNPALATQKRIAVALEVTLGSLVSDAEGRL